MTRLGSQADLVARISALEEQVRRLRTKKALETEGPDVDVVPYSISGNLTVADGGLRWYALRDGEILKVAVSVGTSPSGLTGIGVRLRRNGTSIGTVTLSSGQNYTTFVPTLVTVTQGDYFTVDITSIGNSVPGADLVLEVEVEQETSLE